MPRVGNMRFDYTGKGKRKAAAARREALADKFASMKGRKKKKTTKKKTTKKKTTKKKPTRPKYPPRRY